MVVSFLHCAVQGLRLKRYEGLGFLRATNQLDLCSWRVVHWKGTLYCANFSGKY
jgi:hypothetical protein